MHTQHSADHTRARALVHFSHLRLIWASRENPFIITTFSETAHVRFIISVPDVDQLMHLEILFEISHRFDLSEENRQSDTTGEIYRLLPTFSYDTHRLTPSRFDTISLSVIVHLSTVDEIWLTCLTTVDGWAQVKS